MGRVELHERAQRHLELAVGAGDGRPAVGEGDLGRARLVGDLGLVDLLHLDGVGAELGLELADLGRERLDLGLQPFQPGLARILRGRRHILAGRRGGHCAVLGMGASGRSKRQSAERHARQQPRTRGHGL